MAPRRQRRWLRRLLLAGGLGALLGVILVGAAVTHLELVAAWSIHRVFPGVRAEVGLLKLSSLTELDARGLELRSRESGATILSLEGGVVRFNFNDIWSLRLDKIELVDPVLQISPGLLKALAVGRGAPVESNASPQPPSEGGLGAGWSIAEIEIENGRFIWLPTDESDGAALRLNVSGILKNFGPSGAAANEVHELVLHDIRLDRPGRSGDPWILVPDAAVRFTTAGLFADRRIEEVVIPKGKIEYDKALLPALVFSRNNENRAGGALPDWKVGNLQIDGIDVAGRDLPEPIYVAQFKISGSLNELDLGDAESEHVLEFSDVAIGPDAPDARVRFTSDQIKVTFAAGEILHRVVRAIDLENPMLRLAVEPTTKSEAKPPGKGMSSPIPSLPEFRIERITAPFGSFRLVSRQDKLPNIDARFSLDWENLGSGPASISAEHAITFWDVSVVNPAVDKGKFLTVDIGEIRATLDELLNKMQIRLVDVRGGTLLIGKALEQLVQNGNADNGHDKTAPPEPVDGPGWNIADLRINNIRTVVQDARQDLSDITLTLGTSMTHVGISGAGREFLDELQEVEFANIEILSPVRPDVKILGLRSVFVRFTLKELAQQRLREIVVLRPTIYLNQDLFIYMERATAASSEASSAPQPLPPWIVDRVDVKFGSLVIGGGTAKDVGLPLGFETLIEDIALDNLAELKVQAELDVPRQSYRFPSYQIEVDDVEGDLRFSYPPDKGEQNLVQKLDIRAIRWRQFESDDAWIAVTFDKQGINGQFGGNAYNGYVNGGFSFFFQTDSPWIGWVAGEAVDTASITDIVSPQNFQLTGPLNFEIQLDAFSKRIDRVIGKFLITEPGEMRIGKFDQFIEMIPDDWTSMKSSITQIGLETLRDFKYDDASGKFWFVQSQGVLDLSLTGENGSRKFEVFLHDNESTDAYWTVGNRDDQ